MQNIKIKLGNLDDELIQKIEKDDIINKNRRNKSVPVKLKNDDTSSDTYNEKIADEDYMKNAFDRKFLILYNTIIGFRKKYKVSTYKDVVKIMAKIKDKNIENKFSSFVEYFKTDIQSKKHKISKLHSFANEKDMIDEISKFVESRVPQRQLDRIHRPG